MPFYALLPECRSAVMYALQSQMCSISMAEVKASVYEAPRSMRANISFTKSISCRFKTPEIMLDRWSMSSCVWPTMRKERRTFQKYPRATRLAQYANMYLFLFSLLQLSVCIRNTWTNDPLRLRTSSKTFANDVITWLLSWAWWTSNHKWVYNATLCIRTPQRGVFTYLPLIPLIDWHNFGIMVVFWSMPSIIKHNDSSELMMASLLARQ